MTWATGPSLAKCADRPRESTDRLTQTLPGRTQLNAIGLRLLEIASLASRGHGLRASPCLPARPLARHAPARAAGRARGPFFLWLITRPGRSRAGSGPALAGATRSTACGVGDRCPADGLVADVLAVHARQRGQHGEHHAGRVVGVAQLAGEELQPPPPAPGAPRPASPARCRARAACARARPGSPRPRRRAPRGPARQPVPVRAAARGGWRSSPRTPG